MQKRGGGCHRFASNVSNTTLMVVQVLQECIKPYMSGIKVDINDLNILCSYHDKFIRNDEIFSYSFVTEKKIDKNSKIKIIYNDHSMNKLVELDVVFDKIVKYKDDSLSKLVVGLSLSDHNSPNCKKEKNLANTFQINPCRRLIPAHF